MSRTRVKIQNEDLYIIYLIPLGMVSNKLLEYYESSKNVKINNAHDYLPHSTLCSFFTLKSENKIKKEFKKLIYKFEETRITQK